MRARRGVAILIALGVLTFLSFVGVTFTIGSIISLKAAYNNYYAAKARMAADTGIARALAELRLGDGGATTDAIDIAALSYSGTMDLNRGLTGSYNVTVIDCASRININDENPNLAQILKNLSGTSSPALLTDADCDNIADNRPYSCLEEIKMHISGDTQQEKEDKYAGVAGYLTVYGYVDPLTVNPVDVTSPYAVQPRSPVNVNTASKEVIQAVLSGVTAVHACPNCGGDGQINGPSSSDACGSCSSGTLTIDSTEADLLAQYIVSRRPYSNWSQFYLSVKNCGSIGTRDADLVMANACPNTGFSWIRNYGWASKMGYLGKYLVDWNRNGLADAGDKGLTVHTTEFCFNSGGYYEITSSGEISRSGIPLARNNVVTVAKIYDIYRLTNQQQMEATGSSKANVTTYPEPVEAEVSAPQAAAYDGQIMLAKKTSGGPDASGGSGWFNAPYKVSLSALSAGGSGDPVDVPGGGSNGTKPNVESVANYSDRGELMPEGMLVDMFDQVRAAYKTPGNILAGNGTMEIWFKTQWNSTDSRIYGDSDIDRKMLRLTSGSAIEGFTDPNGVPYFTLFMWSDGGGTYAKALWGGGTWNTSAGAWGFAGSDFYWGDTWFGWPYGGRGWGHWDAGKWNHLAITWINPSPIEGNPEGTYNSAVCPIYVYLNGELKLFSDCGSADASNLNVYYYHSDYEDKGDINYDFMCGNEYSKWNTNQGTFEFSNSVIGSVWIWNSQRSDIQINADLNNGIYVPAGTYVSPLYEPGATVLWGAVTWTQAIPDDIADEGGGVTLSVDTTGTKTAWTGGWTDPSGGHAINTVSDSIAIKAGLSATETESIPEVDNLVVNGGFETGNTSGWVPDGSGAWVSTSSDGAVPHSGTYFFWHRDEFGRGQSGAYQEFPSLNGAQYRLTGWFSASNGGWKWTDEMYMIFYNGSGGVVGSRSLAPAIDPRYQWHYVDTGWVAAPPSAATVRIGFRDGKVPWEVGGCLPFWVAWDDFQLQQKAISTTGTPALETPVLEDVTVTYMQEAQFLYRREF
ncbi:MAG: hypothetical protein PHE80_06365 [Candidatus Omnitrophica bacterium]|nr:hypothetical protein [Candidatus Omnitrophota bacterium]